jgi:hypothetical protein
MRINMGMTVRGYEENCSKTSWERMLRAGPGPAKYANPTTPTKPIAKATGNLIRKRTIRKPIPTMPTATGLIFVLSSLSI